jgi:CPA2 family monovalent cation:H+ antiporter-2
VIVGHGPVGRLVDALLTGAGFRTVVVDMNIDTVRSLARHGRPAVYGDAGRAEVLESAGIRGASHLVLTLSTPEGAAGIVRSARELDPKVEITVRARYLTEREMLLAAGADAVIVEEGETGTAIARHVLARRGTPREVIDRVEGAVRKLWRLGG